MSDERLGELADEFAERVAEGLPIDVAEYQARYPDLADAIPDMLMSIRMLCRMTESHPAQLTHGSAADWSQQSDGPAGAVDRPFADDSRPIVNGAKPIADKLRLGGDQVSSDRPPPPMSEVMATGTQLGDFRIEREIGRGGMGIVYAAEQISLRRPVALKVFPFLPALEPRKLRRFQNEALAAASIDHPHVVPVYAVGFDKATHFYAMRLIDGSSLAEVYQRIAPPSQVLGATQSDRRSGSGSYSTVSGADRTQSRTSAASSSTRQWRRWQRQLARWIRDAALALDHAHEMGVVHRDVKPNNLLIDEQQHCWLTDFGLAATSFGENVTITGDLMGTLPYMSPEQVGGSSPTLDHRTDVYSLGVTLLEGLTGEKPFRHKNQVELVRQIMVEEPRISAATRKRVDPDLLNIACNAIEKSANDRYATARHMAEDLTRYLDGKPVLARRPSAWNRTAKWIRRNPSVTVSAAIVFLVMAVATMMATGAWVRAGAAADTAERLLYLADTRLASDALQKRNTGAARSLLARHIPERGQKDLRGFAWRLLWDRAHPEQLTFAEHAAPVHAVALVPGRRQAVSADASGVVLIWDIDTGKSLRCIGQEDAPINVLEISPDGKSVAIGTRGGRLAIYSLVTGERRAVETRHKRSIHCLAFSPDSSRLYTGGDDREIFIWSVPDLERVGSHDAGQHTVRGLGITHDGGRIAAAVAEYDIGGWNLHDGGWLFGIPDPAKVMCLAVSPTRYELAYATQTGIVVLMRNSVPVTLWRKQVSGQRIYDLSFSQDGNFLAVAGRDRVAYVLDAKSGETLESFPGHTERIYGVALTDDGRELVTASADGTCKRYVLGRSDQPEYLMRRKPENGKKDSYWLELSHHASRTFVAKGDGQMSVHSQWNVVPLEGRRAGGEFARFSESGRLVATTGTPLLSTSWQTPDVDPIVQRLDVDLDGDLDYRAALGNQNRCVWQESLPDGNRGPIRVGVSSGPHFPSVQWCGTGSWNSHLAQLHTSQGELLIRPVGAFDQPIKVPLDHAHAKVSLIDDLDHDGNSEILYRTILPAAEGPHFWMLTATREGQIVSAPTETTVRCRNSNHRVILAAHDVDEDGLRDIIAAHEVAGEVVWYRQHPARQFEAPETLLRGLDQPDLLEFADVNGDGREDLLTVSGKTVVWAAKQERARYDAVQSLNVPLESLPVRPPLGQLTVWDTATGKPLQVYDDAHAYRGAPAFSMDETLVAIATAEPGVRVYAVANGACVASLSLTEPLTEGVKFLPDNRHLIIFHGDDCLLWDIRKHEVKTRFTGHESTVRAACVSSDGRTLFTVSNDHTANIWDIGSGKRLRTMLEFDHAPWLVCLSHDEQTLAVVTMYNDISLWDVQSAQLLAQWQQSGAGIATLAFSYNDDALVVGVCDENEGDAMLIRYAAPRTSESLRRGAP